MPAILDHPSFPQPKNPDARIWRYMDFAKLLWLSQQQSLYFPRLDQFSDPFEGSLSKEEYERLKVVAELGEKRGSIPPEWRGQYFDVLINSARWARVSTYIGCWHLADNESEAMWRLYGATYTVAIQSTYRRLADLLPGNMLNGCYLGLVRYTDHHSEPMPSTNVFDPIMHKRRAFEHEHEVRAVVWNAEPAQDPRIRLDSIPKGIALPIDLSKLIEHIFVSPASPSWFAETVQRAVETYRKGTPVMQSDLNRVPYI